MNSKLAKYEKRVVAYIDILGFKNLINQTITKQGRDRKNAIAFVDHVYKTIRREFHQYLNLRRQPCKFDSIRFTMFSDSIVLSILAKHEYQIAAAVDAIRKVQMKLLRNGIIFRGAMTIGKLRHTASTLFGPALIEAYQIESAIAIFPRVVVSEEIATIMRNYPFAILDVTGVPMYISILDIDFDKLPYINYFICYNRDCEEFVDLDTYWYIADLFEVIMEGLLSGQYLRSENILKKYQYLADKFNSALKYYQRAAYINYLCCHDPIDYNKIMKIKHWEPIDIALFRIKEN